MSAAAAGERYFWLATPTTATTANEHTVLLLLLHSTTQCSVQHTATLNSNEQNLRFVVDLQSIDIAIDIGLAVVYNSSLDTQ